MDKLSYGLRELGLIEEDIYFDDNLSSEFTNDPRQELWKKQKEELGFDARELWDLDFTMAHFIYPRIKYFKDHYAEIGYPCEINSNEEWTNILDNILFAFKEILTNYKCCISAEDTTQYYKKIDNGLFLFAKYFRVFWW